MWKFLKSAIKQEDFFHNGSHQVCFWGRSNVGKSSLINALINQNISFVSKNPGRTRLINYFIDNNQKLLVDLPGYGYARMSQDQQAQMLQGIENYLNDTRSSKNIILLIDSRTGITKIDWEIIQYLNYQNWPIDLVYTKIDKLNQKEKSQLIKKHNEYINNQLLKNIGSVFFISSAKNINISELVMHIEELLYKE